MALRIIHAKNKQDMEDIEKELSSNKFKVRARESHYVLMKKKRYGNPIIQLGLLALALFIVPVPYAYILVMIVVAYFSYSFLVKSPNVLVTTDSKDKEGNPLEFNTIDEVLEEGNSIL
ncbi:MAG: hypothetical protein Q4P18_05240 [Methanobrevibacter sp.]|uniref:hypothetical protein n=1 Tax=Methanobrevibacter sp. TaxID=66852 RepID=UPI0026E01C52|nr:hypothetical protein [Methanobrevibacter sp.]MDO5848917.1 hypothetical protein [Methanobrevibacter sp.]